MQKTRDLTSRETRKTAFAVAAALSVIALLLWYRERVTIATVLGAIAAALIITGAFFPPLALLFHRVWMRFAYALGYVNSHILLTLVYFFIFVPYGIISRLAGRDPLDLRSAKTSYWHKRKHTRQSKEGFERLF